MKIHTTGGLNRTYLLLTIVEAEEPTIKALADQHLVGACFRFTGGDFFPYLHMVERR